MNLARSSSEIYLVKSFELLESLKLNHLAILRILPFRSHGIYAGQRIPISQSIGGEYTWNFGGSVDLKFSSVP